MKKNSINLLCAAICILALNGCSINGNGELKTYTIPDSAFITKGMEKESASVTDLSADTVVRITLNEDTVSNISIIN